MNNSTSKKSIQDVFKLYVEWGCKRGKYQWKGEATEAILEKDLSESGWSLLEFYTALDTMRDTNIFRNRDDFATWLNSK